jgi:hypothetical protein
MRTKAHQLRNAVTRDPATVANGECRVLLRPYEVAVFVGETSATVDCNPIAARDGGER